MIEIIDNKFDEISNAFQKPTTALFKSEILDKFISKANLLDMKLKLQTQH